MGRQKDELESAIVEHVAALPGVVAAGIGSRPLGGGGIGTSLELPGRELEDPFMSVDPVTPGFLEALGAGLAEARFFSSADTARSHGVAVLNEAAVRVLWPQGSALGQVVLFNGRRVEVVGVLADVRRGALKMAPKPTVYVPSSQAPDFWSTTSSSERRAIPWPRSGAARGDAHDRFRDQALVRINTLEETLDAAKAPRRFRMQLAGIFSILALGLAALGIYGVTAGSIVERVPEIGVRITCGATTLDVVVLWPATEPRWSSPASCSASPARSRSAERCQDSCSAWNSDRPCHLRRGMRQSDCRRPLPPAPSPPAAQPPSTRRLHCARGDLSGLSVRLTQSPALRGRGG